MTQHEKHDLSKHVESNNLGVRAVDADGRCPICGRQVAPPTEHQDK